MHHRLPAASGQPPDSIQGNSLARIPALSGLQHGAVRPLLATDGALERAIERVLDHRSPQTSDQTLNPLWPSSQDEPASASGETIDSTSVHVERDRAGARNFHSPRRRPHRSRASRSPTANPVPSPAHLLCLLAPRLRDRVVRGEFMDLSELLPTSLSLSHTHQHEQCDITLPLHGAPGSNTVQLVATTRRPAPHTICDF